MKFTIKDKNLLINGRLGKNLYVDMDQIVAMAMNVAKSEQLIF
jgi:UDP-galactopyranose mutase